MKKVLSLLFCLLFLAVIPNEMYTVSFAAKTIYYDSETAPDFNGFDYELDHNEATITGFKMEYDEVNDYYIKPHIPKSIEIPSTVDGYPVTRIGDGAFIHEEFESVKIPDTVTVIEAMAFMDCEELISISIPDSVKEILGEAFCGCKNLFSINISDTAVVGIRAFDDTGWFVSQPEGMTYIGKAAYRMKGECPSEVEIMPGTFSISGGAFEGSETLESITIPDTVEYIGNNAFQGCSQLKSVKISDIAEWCQIEFGIDSYPPFSAPYNLYVNDEPITELIIPDTVTSISSSAFRLCSSLKRVIIPDSVTRIDSYAFFGCENLEEIIASVSVIYVGSEACDNTLWIENHPDGIVYVGSVAYKAKGDLPDEVEIKQGTYDIGIGAFQSCVDLKSVVIPDSVSEIEGLAFFGCLKLKSVIIPKSVTCIRWRAFGYYIDHGIKKDDDFIIYGYSGTEGERYANENGFTFVEINDELIGDTDGDGAVTPMDVTNIQCYLSFLKTSIKGSDLMKADVDKNGVLEVIDATYIQRWLAKMDVPYKIG